MTTAPARRTRRSVLTGGIVAAAGIVAGFVYARGTSAAEARPAGAAANAYGNAPSSTGKALIAVAAVPPGGGTILDSAGVVVTKDPSGAIHAFSSTCTHQGCTVNSVSDGTINCPCHGSRFDVRTGAPVAGPASRPLPAVAVTVRGGEVVTA
jgi:Rieske Fe-S protein